MVQYMSQSNFVFFLGNKLTEFSTQRVSESITVGNSKHFFKSNHLKTFLFNSSD